MSCFYLNLFPETFLPRWKLVLRSCHMFWKVFQVKFSSKDTSQLLYLCSAALWKTKNNLLLVLCLVVGFVKIILSLSFHVPILYHLCRLFLAFLLLRLIISLICLDIMLCPDNVTLCCYRCVQSRFPFSLHQQMAQNPSSVPTWYLHHTTFNC